MYQSLSEFYCKCNSLPKIAFCKPCFVPLYYKRLVSRTPVVIIYLQKDIPSVPLFVQFLQEGSPTKFWVSRSWGLPRSTPAISNRTSSLWHFQSIHTVSKRLRCFPCRQLVLAALAYDFTRHEHYGHLSTVRAWTFLYNKRCSDYPNAIKGINNI